MRREEIVKWGFWRKLPLFDHFCGTPTQWMKISDFIIYSFTNDLLPWFIQFGLYEKFQLRPLVPRRIFHNLHNLL